MIIKLNILTVSIKHISLAKLIPSRTKLSPTTLRIFAVRICDEEEKTTTAEFFDVLGCISSIFKHFSYLDVLSEKALTAAP